MALMLMNSDCLLAGLLGVSKSPRRNLFFCTVLLLSVMCYVSPAYSRPITPLEGLEALRKGFAAINDFTGEISQEKRLLLMKRSIIMTGNVRFRKPDTFFIEINPPLASRMILRDSIIEQATGRGGEHNRIVLPPEQGLKRWLAKLSTPVKSLPEGVAMQADLSGGVYTLIITPSGKGQVRELTVIFQEDGLIRKLVINEQNGDRATMTFKNVKRNVGLSDKDFSLE